MHATRIGAVAADLATLFGAGTVGGLGDAELLRRFVEGRGDPSAQAAFASLVARHGALVRGVCRRILRDLHAADDASQAVFLVLARKARTIRCEGSLAPWLHGVGVRIALRSRSSIESRRASELEGIDPAGPDPSPSPAERDELLAAIDAEIARLPERHRAAVVLCHLEGLDHREAARRLRCPLGTLESRLHRARGRLRARLARRGLAPGGLTLAWSALGASSRAARPASFVGSTRVPGGPATARVAMLAGRSARRIAARPLRWIAAAMIGLGGLGGGIGLTYRGAEAGDGAVGKTQAPAPASSVGDQIRAVLAEWKAFAEAYERFQAGKRTKEERAKALDGYAARYVLCSQKLLGLVELQPKDPAALDAILWHVSDFWKSGKQGPIPDQQIRSVEVLLRHFADEPRVAWRVQAARNGPPNRLDDRLLPGLAEGARRRQAKGLALLALAEYVEEKAGYVARVKESKPPFTLGRPGGPQTRPFDIAYEKELRAQDAALLRREAHRLFARVATECGDVWNAGRDEDDPEYLLWTVPSFLGDSATKHLDALHGDVFGATNEISWRDRDGGTTRLSDYRGKVVVLAFWRDGEGSCRREFAHDAELARKWAGRPFVLVGFTQPAQHSSDSTARYSLPFRRLDGREVVAEDVLIRERLGVWHSPTTVVLDTEGVVRFRCGESLLLEGYIDQLVREAEAKAARK